MAYSGQVDDNAATGQRLVYRRTTAQTGGQLLEVEAFYRPGGLPPPEHYHPAQEEQFELLSGCLRVRLDGREQILTPGQVLVIPAGTRHSMCCDGDDEARVVWQTYPALGTESLHETLWALARLGKTNERGVPHLLQMAVLLRAHRREFRLARPPYIVQWLLFGTLALLGRALRYRPNLQIESVPLRY